jgi:hypothetical protein
MSATGMLIDGITRDALKEPLRQCGYKKDRRTFRRSLEHCVQIMNVQASSWNEGSSGRFTVNFGVYFWVLADLGGIGRLTDKPIEPDCLVRCRIGHLLPDKNDRWWEVKADEDHTSVVSEVRQACICEGQAWLDAHSDLSSARSFLVGQGSLYWASVASLALNERDAASGYLVRAIEAWPAGTGQLEAWGRRHGLLVQ